MLSAVLVAEIAALRLTYPIAIVLVEQAWAGFALVLATVPIGLSILRGWIGDRVTRTVRARLFDAVSEAIENYPAVAPVGSPPIEQLEAQISRAIPWVEALIGVTLPSILGNAVALPVIAGLSWIRIGGRATVVATLAMGAGIAVGAAVARRSGALGDAAWLQYQPIARLIENGFRGRIELGVHNRSGAHRARLLAEVANWSAAERRSFVWGSTATWLVPVVTALTACFLARLTGADLPVLLHQVVNHPSRSVVVAGLLALSAFPVLSSFSRSLAEWSRERPHLKALERFVELTHGRKQMLASSSSLAGVAVGSIRADQVRFRYPGRRSGEPPSVIEANLVWEAHETLAIVGPNGCGKTTLTWLLMGIIEPEAGRITAQIADSSQPATALVGRIAYLPQQPYFDELETVREAIHFVAPRATNEAIEALISALLAGHFCDGLQAFLDRAVMSLSTGERRAVALARVLLREAELVLLDEPEANLDTDIRARVMHALSAAKSRCRMLIVTHDEAFAALADRTHRMPPRSTLSAPKP